MYNSSSLLKIEAEIISLNKEDFIIKIKNSEKDEVIEVDNVKDFASYLINSINNSKSDYYKIIWLPSPKAKRKHIDLIGMQLGMMQQWMEDELKFPNDI